MDEVVESLKGQSQAPNPDMSKTGVCGCLPDTVDAWRCRIEPFSCVSREAHLGTCGHMLSKETHGAFGGGARGEKRIMVQRLTEAEVAFVGCMRLFFAAITNDLKFIHLKSCKCILFTVLEVRQSKNQGSEDSFWVLRYSFPCLSSP